MYIKKIFHQSILYGIGVFFTSLVSFLLLPIYTRYLSVKEFGEISLILAAIFLLQYIFNMGIYSGFMMRYFDLNDTGSQKRLISTVLIFYIVFLLIVSTLLHIFNVSVSILMIGRVDTLVLSCVLMIAAFETLLTMPMLMFRITDSPLKYIIINIIKSSGAIIFVFFALKILNGGVSGAVFAQMSAVGIAVLLVYILTYKQYMLYFSIRELWISFKLGLPIFVIMIAFWFVDFSNRFIVKHFLTLESLAIYSLGFKIGQLILFFITIFQTVWQPLMFKVFKEAEAKRLFSDIFTYLALVLILAALSISIFSNELISVFSTKSYTKSADIVTMTVITYTLFGFFYYLQTPLLLNKRLYTVAFLSCLAAILNVILSFLLIPLYDINGAIISIFITYFTMVILILILAQRNYKIPYDYLRFVKIIMSALIIFILANLIKTGGIYIVVYKVIILSLFFILLFMFRFFNIREMIYLKSRINTIFA